MVRGSPAEAYGPMDMGGGLASAMANLGGPQDAGMGGQSAYDPHASQMQGQYPAGAVMTTFNGGQAGGPPPMETGGGGGHESHGGDEHGGHVGIDKETGIAPRRCTDIQCCFIWLVFTLLLITLMMMSRWYGNVAALTHGRDYYGRVCGVSAGVENMPWLYWCRSDPASTGVPTSLQMTYPSCVAACPSSVNVSVMIPCLRDAEVAPGLIPGGQFGNVKTQEVRMQESLVYTAPYPTSPRGGRFCVPTDDTLRLSVLEDWNALHPFGRIMRNVNAGTLGNLSWIFLIVTIVAVVLGYFFYFCIKNCPKTITIIFVYPAAVLTGIVALWLVLALIVLIQKDIGFSQWYMSKANPLYQHYSWTMASVFSLVGAFLVGGVSLTLVGMGMGFDGASVGDLINAGMGCMKEVPGMYYAPAVEAFVKWLIFIFFADGLRWFFYSRRSPQEPYPCQWCEVCRPQPSVELESLVDYLHYYMDCWLRVVHGDLQQFLPVPHLEEHCCLVLHSEGKPQEKDEGVSHGRCSQRSHTLPLGQHCLWRLLDPNMASKPSFVLAHLGDGRRLRNPDNVNWQGTCVLGRFDLQLLRVQGLLRSYCRPQGANRVS